MKNYKKVILGIMAVAIISAISSSSVFAGPVLPPNVCSPNSTTATR